MLLIQNHDMRIVGAERTFTSSTQAVGQAYKSRADTCDRKMEKEIEEGPVSESESH